VSLELGKHVVHDGLYRTGSIGSRGVAVNPALGVHDVGNTRSGAADGELEGSRVELAACQIVEQGLHLGFVVHHELDIVTGGKPQVAVTMLVGDFADFADVGDRHQAGTAAANGIDFVSGFGHVDQNAGLQHFVIEPFAFVGGDDRRVELIVFLGTDIGDAVLHRFIGIVS
jgi:hypothetical protein